MGTRSLTRVYDEENRLVLFMYSQMDGYPSGHGADLHKTLGKIKLVNGISMEDGRQIANGMGCFAAQLVTAMKDGPGGIYLHAPSEEFGWADYVYDFRPNVPGHPGWEQGKKAERHLMLKVTSHYNNLVLYDGPFSEFDPAKAEKVGNDYAEQEEQNA
jgi:hypothetical protein